MKISCSAPYCRSIRVFGLAVLLLVGGGLPGRDAALSASPAASELPTAMALYREYLESNGGRSSLQAVQTLVLSGRIEQAAGETIQFQIFRKRPDSIRFKVEGASYRVETIFNGSDGWRERISARGERTLTELEADEVRQLKQDGAIEGPFFRAGMQDEFVTPVALEEVRGHPAVRVAVDAEAACAYDTIWLSQEHHQEVKLARLSGGETGEASVLEEVFISDFAQVDGVYIAKRMEYYVDGALSKTVVVDRIRANIGIFSSFFERN